MKTEYKLINALRDLMSKNFPLEEITVNLLTKKCKVSRPTFYYHFHDIYDLVTLLFLQETIPNIHRSKNVQKVQSCIFSYYKSNENFVNVVLNSNAKELFVELLYINIYQALLRILNELDEDNVSEANDRKNVAKFYAIGFANTITFYLETAKEKTLNGLEEALGFLDSEFLQKSIKNIAKHKVLNKKDKK